MLISITSEYRHQLIRIDFVLNSFIRISSYDETISTLVATQHCFIFNAKNFGYYSTIYNRNIIKLLLFSRTFGPCESSFPSAATKAA
ncbi:hypothetical protein D3C87_1827100 [compost metagenome]